jgi:hypothetical protein
MKNYNASQFFDAMFLTPPYPSSLEVMIFAVLQDETNNGECSAGAGYVGASASYWGEVARMADSYPNIHLVYEIAFNASQGVSGTYGLRCFNTLVQSFAQYPSVYGLGVEGEFTEPASALTLGEMQIAMGDVNSTGKQFINYYVPSAIIPAGGFDIAHTNFPMQGDQVGSLQKADSRTIGLSSGYYDSFAFPSNFTCPIGPNDVASGNLTNEPQGYDQCVISTEISSVLSFPGPQRQYLELAPGFSSSGEFAGASGQATDQLWDSPLLRGWIWTDPVYTANFLLST